MVAGGSRRAGKGPARCSCASRHAQLIAEDLHRLGEIERGIFGIGRDHDRGLAKRELLVLESGAFVAEDHRHPLPGTDAAERLGRGLAGGEEGDAHASTPGRGSESEVHVEQRRGELGADLGLGEQFRSPGGHRLGFRVGEAIGCHQDQAPQAHRSHRAGAGADVARVGGA